MQSEKSKPNALVLEMSNKWFISPGHSLSLLNNVCKSGLCNRGEILMSQHKEWRKNGTNIQNKYAEEMYKTNLLIGQTKKQQYYIRHASSAKHD